MSVIKQISIFNGSNWDTPADIGANAENIDFTYTTGSQQGNTAALSSILPAQALTASRVLVTDSNGKLSSSSISSGILNTALSGASTTTSLQSQINTLNTNLNNPINTSFLYTMSLPTATTNFNDFPNRSIVWVNNTQNTFTNAPAQAAYYVITVFPIPRYGFQLAIHYNSSTGSPACIRTMVGNTWNSWKNITLN